MKIKYRNKGSVLIMTLMVVLVLFFSLFLISDMMLVGEKITGNEQMKLIAYQNVYNELILQKKSIISNSFILTQAKKIPQNLLPKQLNTCQHKGDICHDIVLKYIGKSLPPTGYSIQMFVSDVFELNNKGSIKGLDVVSDQTLKLIYVNHK